MNSNIDQPTQSLRRDARVIGVVSLAHGVSHFLQLALPPLFPLLRAEFDVSWTLLGFIAGTFYIASGIVQFGAGFVVDRLGARPVLLGGMTLLVAGTLLGSLAPNPWWLFPCAAIMGAGNGVFHPSDFAILNANVTTRRLGHAYSTHGVGGNLGYALAPIVSFGLGAAFGWRFAMAAMGICGLLVLGVLASQRHILTSHRAPDAHLHTLRRSVALFVKPAILLCFLYFVFQTAAAVGLQTFLPSALNAGLAVPLVVATSAVTAYLLGGTAGIVIGGFLAVRTSRHDRVAATGLLLGAALLALIAAKAVPLPWIVPVFVVIGLFIGATGAVARPDRTQRNAEGRCRARVWLRLFGTRLGRDARPDLVRHHARPRACARSVLRHRRTFRRRDRNRRAGATRGGAAAGVKSRWTSA